MSLQKASGKNKRVVRMCLMQPTYYSRRTSGRITISLRDILDNTDTYKEYKHGYVEKTWKSIDGIDLTMYYQRLKDIKEILDVCFEGKIGNNHYYQFLQNEYNKMLLLCSELHTIHTDISCKGKRAKTFQIYKAPLIKVDN